MPFPPTAPAELPRPATGDAERQPGQRTLKPASVRNSLELRKQLRVGRTGGQGSKDTVRSTLDAGLNWLKRQQQKSGQWQLHQGYPDPGLVALRTDTGATALALLAFLGDGHTHQEGEFRDTVDRGLTWLRGIQKADGDFHDHEDLGRQTSFYAHAQATIVICEALAMTGDESLRPAAERAVAFLLKTQQPQQGGWRYTPQTIETMGDLSVTGWVLMALHTARMARVDVPPEAYDLASRFLDAVASGIGSRYRYLPSDPDTKSSVGMTAEGLLCRQWLGWERDDIAMKEGIGWLLKPEHTPEWAPGKRNVYEWYYVAQALHNMGGPPWTAWFETVRGEVTQNQRRTGSRKPGEDVMGSWNPHTPSGHRDEHSHMAGRLYVTVMCLLILETPTRHAPLYEQPAVAQ